MRLSERAHPFAGCAPVLLSLLLALSGCALSGCDETTKVTPVLDAGAASPRVPPPTREGCARVGPLFAIENDPACVVKRANEEGMRATLKSLSITLTAESSEVIAGGTTLLHLTIKNTSPAEATLLFEARPRPVGPRTDWSRMAGIPEPHVSASETPRLLFPLTTLDAYDRDVDAVPTIPGSSMSQVSPTLLAVHVRPGGKLTHSISWWALRIPAPAPVVTDDAGHRYTPKTYATPLTPGEYTVVVDLPLHGLSREERKQTIRLGVRPAPLLDGGVRRRPF